MSYQRRHSFQRNMALEPFLSSYGRPTPYARNVDPLRRRGLSNLKILRRARGLTLETLSKLTGISPSYLSRLEAGARRLNTDLMNKLSPVLGCEPADLLGSSLSPMPSVAKHPSHLLHGEATSRNTIDSPKAPMKNVFHHDLPVYSASFLSKEEENSYEGIIDFKVASDWAARPPQLHNINGAFGLYISSLQYAPRFSSGDILLVHPTRPLSVGCSFLFLKNDGEMMLCIFLGWEKEGVRAYPAARSEDYALVLPKEKTTSFYRIVGNWYN